MHRLCLHPLLHDLPSSSFQTTTTSLRNPWALNSKGIYTASFVTYLPDGSSLSDYRNNSNTEIDLDDSVKIVVQLPKETLVKGIWWASYNQDVTNGIITRFGNYK